MLHQWAMGSGARDYVIANYPGLHMLGVKQAFACMRVMRFETSTQSEVVDCTVQLSIKGGSKQEAFFNN